MKNLKEEEDFFDLGVSSLTIIELQIMIEQTLGIVVPTSKLMRSSTIKEWIEIYSDKGNEESVLSLKESSTLIS